MTLTETKPETSADGALTNPAAAPVSPQIADHDLQTILVAWNAATDRLQKTHESLRAEIGRLTAELEAKNRELARQNRLADLGQMAAHIAHEVRNGLVPIKLYLSLLKRRLTSEPSSLDVLEKAMAGFLALEVTVSDLLHFSAERDPSLDAVDLSSLLREICESLGPQLQAQGIQTEVQTSDQAIAAHADRDMLRRAILNLVLNALDVMPSGGKLLVSAFSSASQTTITVADSGPGIPHEVAERVFEPFFSTKSTGTGLGLAIVERIAHAHDGTISVANVPSGGAQFTLQFPHLPTTSDNNPKQLSHPPAPLPLEAAA